MKTYFLAIIVCFLFIMGCTKDKPEPGSYIGVFNGTYIQNNIEIEQQRYIELELIKSTKNYIEFKDAKTSSNYFKITKNKHKVDGVLDVSIIRGGSSTGCVFGPITINGEWSKNNKNYTIEGDFSYEYKIVNSSTQITDIFIVSGKFQIK